MSSTWKTFRPGPSISPPWRTGPTVAALVQGGLRVLSPLGDTVSPSPAAVTARYALASAPVTSDGKAAVHMEGLAALEDIACLAVKEEGKPLRWKRVTWPWR